MTRYIAAYDTENPGCLAACRQIVAMHRRHEMPGAFFIVGKTLEAAPEEYRAPQALLFQEEATRMETMDISLPDQMREFVEELVRQGDYGSASEYVQELIREDRRRRAKQRLEALLLEGLESGPATEMTPADWEAIRHEVRQRSRRDSRSLTRNPQKSDLHDVLSARMRDGESTSREVRTPAILVCQP